MKISRQTLGPIELGYDLSRIAPLNELLFLDIAPIRAKVK